MSLRDFISRDTGAVTVEWVVLAAAVVGLGMGTAAALQGGISGLGTRMDTTMGTSGGEVTECAVRGIAPSIDTVSGGNAPSVDDGTSGLSDAQLRSGLADTLARIQTARASGANDITIAEFQSVAAIYTAALERRGMTSTVDTGLITQALVSETGCSDSGPGVEIDTGGTVTLPPRGSVVPPTRPRVIPFAAPIDGPVSDPVDSAGYSLLAMTDLDPRMADTFSGEISFLAADQLLQLFGENETSYYDAVVASDDLKARIMLDQMYLTVQEANLRRDMANDAVSLDSHFQHALAAYQPSLR